MLSVSSDPTEYATTIAVWVLQSVAVDASQEGEVQVCQM